MKRTQITFWMLSRVFTLAIEYGKAHHNPCKGRLFKLDNQRYRYLLPEEEPRLLSELIGRREHLRSQVIVSIGAGLRKREMLNFKAQTCLRYERATDAVKRAAVQAAMLGGRNSPPAGHKMDTWKLRAV